MPYRDDSPNGWEIGAAIAFGCLGTVLSAAGLVFVLAAFVLH